MPTWNKLQFKDSPLSVAQGEVSGHSPRNIFGYQLAVTTSFIPAWEYAAPYVYPTNGLLMSVTSTNASDNGNPVKILGLDVNYNVIEETVILPGITAKQFFRINDVLYLGAGGNAGLISVSNGGVNYGAIRIGDGRNQSSIYTVPAGKCFFLYRIDAFSADSTAAKPGIFKNVSITSTGQVFDVARTTFFNNMNIQRRIPFKYDEKTDIQFQVRTPSGTHEMNVFAEGILTDIAVLRK